MKKFLCVILALVMCVGVLCACSSDKDDSQNPEVTGTPATYEPSGEYIKGTVTIYGSGDEVIATQEVSVSQFIATNAVNKALDLAGIEYRSVAGTLEMVNGIEASETHSWFYIIDGLNSSNGNFPIEDGFELQVHYFTNEQ